MGVQSALIADTRLAVKPISQIKDTYKQVDRMIDMVNDLVDIYDHTTDLDWIEKKLYERFEEYIEHERKIADETDKRV